ncbi:MAG: hypothetical protein HYV63_04660 [Candidatus Schekmanbacteria bacterium]|nr:hypothetical protein [Candidatus Schekmanbacteria bacterium]
MREIWVDSLGRAFDEYVDWLIVQCGSDPQILSQEARQELKRHRETPGEIKNCLWPILEQGELMGEEVITAESVRRGAGRDPGNLLGELDRIGFKSRDVANEVGARPELVEKILRGTYGGRSQARLRVLEVAKAMLRLCQSPFAAAALGAEYITTSSWAQSIPEDEESAPAQPLATESRRPERPSRAR